jgi:hypothetical protein
MGQVPQRSRRVNRCPGCSWPHPATDRLNRALWGIEREPDTVELLPDVTLAALDRWTGRANLILITEINRRYRGCGRLPRWFR